MYIYDENIFIRLESDVFEKWRVSAEEVVFQNWKLGSEGLVVETLPTYRPSFCIFTYFLPSFNRMAI